ncbi:MAG: hypothetical protein K6G88_11700 [Lachnospiraceae bacterium]|jgi:hypothetical protein|nr:hypothetical protein [Lachnospiraceae bacterium]
MGYCLGDDTKGSEQCAFIITDEEAKNFIELGSNAFVYGQKLAKENEVADKIYSCALIDCGGFYRLQVTY